MIERVPAEKIRAALTAKLARYEEVRGELVKLLQMETTLKNSLEETKLVLEEVRKLDDETQLYKLVGFVFVPVKKADLVKELEEKIKSLTDQLARVSKMRAEAEAELKRLENEIRELASGGRGAPVGG